MVKTGEIGASATVAPRPGTELDDSRRRGGYLGPTRRAKTADGPLRDQERVD